MTSIKIDLNSPVFQCDLFDLEKSEQTALIKALKKIQQLTWHALYSCHSLKWEIILSKQTTDGERLYTFRFAQKHRVVALRQADYLRVLSLHADHDSIYKK